MGRSQRIGQDDVRALLRIVGELHSDPLAQGEHLITRLCELVGARMGVLGVVRWSDSDGPPEPLRLIMGGDVDASLVRGFGQYRREVHSDDLLLSTMLPRADKPLAHAREELVPNREWYRHAYVDLFRRRPDA